MYDLPSGQIEAFLTKLYSLPQGNFLQGYKSPMDVSSMQAVQLLGEHFPRTKLIVGTRRKLGYMQQYVSSRNSLPLKLVLLLDTDPVCWFESLFNFCIQNLKPSNNHFTFPKPSDLIGQCTSKCMNTCTAKGEFALYLRQLGKTLSKHNVCITTGEFLPTLLEQQMYKESGIRNNPYQVKEITNPLFLFDVEQLTDPTQKGQLRVDLSDFLELETLLPPLDIHVKPGRVWNETSSAVSIQAMKDSLKINICHPEHISLRKELMRMAQSSSVWFHQYLLEPEVVKNHQVYVS